MTDPTNADQRLINSWSVSIDEVLSNPDLRLDAAHYDRAVAVAVDSVRSSGVELVPLSDLASLHLPGQFTRIWAMDREHGLPYVNATDLLAEFALGRPGGEGRRYLSHATDTDIDNLVVHTGWLLLTCSGTIGRVFHVPPRMDGWVATHDLIRIIPKECGITGYLFACLGTSVVQKQILSYTHGGQIDHVTDAQIVSIVVPMLSAGDIEQIDLNVLSALNAQEEALNTLRSDEWLRI